MWPYRKIVTQSLKTPLMIARIMFYLALLLVFPLPMIMLSDSPAAEIGRFSYILVTFPIAMGLMLISSLMAILIAMVESAFFKIVVAQSCFKQPLFAPARVSRAAPDLASRHR